MTVECRRPELTDIQHQVVIWTSRRLGGKCSPRSLPQSTSAQTVFLSQVVKHLPKAHILACTPSNSGADLLCQRLRVHLPSSIYRLLAPSRDIRMVPEDIKVYKELQRTKGRWMPGRSSEHLKTCCVTLGG